ncbi:hypothetical protein RFI_17775 [Reticulomyxa filosa]|uniref:Uncharacterized protein n=1 Tax=Reticulomyxa filosa TaxID=46433 RepID=X6N085_RETFI|nr:hypothetical protein RFI_17775 [Reticulomyxa filosa]|eukprot:ETO19456.1 hypothetical protein RFI_17775 [Reticulomyxa filosa]
MILSIHKYFKIKTEKHALNLKAKSYLYVFPIDKKDKIFLIVNVKKQEPQTQTFLRDLNKFSLLSIMLNKEKNLLEKNEEEKMVDVELDPLVFKLHYASHNKNNRANVPPIVYTTISHLQQHCLEERRQKYQEKLPKQGAPQRLSCSPGCQDTWSTASTISTASATESTCSSSPKRGRTSISFPTKKHKSKSHVSIENVSIYAANRSKRRKKLGLNHISPLKNKNIQLCAFIIKGGKRITPIRFCGMASPKLHQFLNLFLTFFFFCWHKRVESGVEISKENFFFVCLFVFHNLSLLYRVVRAHSNFHKLLSKLGDNISNMVTRHAEIGAINGLPPKCRQFRYLKRCTLVVIRFIEPPPQKKWARLFNEKVDDCESELDLQLGCSRPCTQCLSVLRGLHIRSVVYCNEKGELVNESPFQIQGASYSGGTKAFIEQW